MGRGKLRPVFQVKGNKMTTNIFNPFKQPATETAVAGAAPAPQKDEQELATANALSNDQVDMCPKCGGKMVEARIYNGTPVFYCDPCRVTHPTC